MNITTYPSFRTEGINDRSARVQIVENTPVAQFTPLFPIMTEFGRQGIKLMSATEFNLHYGSKSLDPTSNYFTHQTEALLSCVAGNNATIAVSRVVPKTAKTAAISIGVDAFFPDQWFLAYGQDALKEVSYTPVLSIFADNEGEWGNQYAISIKKATIREKSVLRINQDVEVYKFRLLKIDQTDYRPLPIANLQGEYDTFFTFKPDSVGLGGIDYYFNSIMPRAYYQLDDDITRTPILGRFELHFDNLVELASNSANFDSSKEVWNQDLDSLFGKELLMISPFSGEQHIALAGGSDGYESDMTSYITKRLERVKVYDDAVFEFLDSLTEDSPFTDMAKYPYSCIIDTGFSFRTKTAMRTVLNVRRDIWAIMSCYIEADYFKTVEGDTYFDYVPKQTEGQLQATASKLKQSFQLYPESYKFGTSALRVMIVKNSGIKNNSPYNRRRSLAIAIVDKLVPFLGGSDGEWISSAAIDSEENRILDGWSEIEGVNMTHASRLEGSENGLTYLETFDTRRFFFPYYRTIYNDSTSVLNDFLTMIACCYIEKLGAEGWRRFGGVPMPEAKRAEKVSRFILEGLRNKFNDRFSFRTRVTDTNLPTATTDIVVEIYADKVKTTNTYIVEAYRQDQLEITQV